jgi:hypothetical protein
MDAWRTRLASQRQELLDDDDNEEDDLALRIMIGNWGWKMIF